MTKEWSSEYKEMSHLRKGGEREEKGASEKRIDPCMCLPFQIRRCMPPLLPAPLSLSAELWWMSLQIFLMH